MQLEELARLRHGCYRLFAALLLYPDAERRANLVVAARALQLESDSLAAFAFFAPWQRLLTTLDGLTENEMGEMEDTYVRLFSSHAGGAVCQASESCHLDPRGQAAGWIAAQLEHEYAAAGLMLLPTAQELPDHAAVELEFMAFLCDQEAQAWDAAALAAGLQMLERQGAFLEQHLGRWFPTFARHLAVTEGAGLYAVIADAAHTFIYHDQELTTLLWQRMRCQRNAV
jgi:TorA maturation chaperone TorD